MTFPIALFSQKIRDGEARRLEAVLETARSSSLRELAATAGADGDDPASTAVFGNAWLNHKLEGGLKVWRRRLACYPVSIIATVATAAVLGILATALWHVFQSSQHTGLKIGESLLLGLPFLALTLLLVIGLRDGLFEAFRDLKDLVDTARSRVPRRIERDLVLDAGTAWRIGVDSVHMRGDHLVRYDDTDLKNWSVPYGDLWSISVSTDKPMLGLINSKGPLDFLFLDASVEAYALAATIFENCFSIGHLPDFRVLGPYESDDHVPTEDVISRLRAILPDDAVVIAKEDSLRKNRIVVFLSSPDFILSGGWMVDLQGTSVEYVFNRKPGDERASNAD